MWSLSIGLKPQRCRFDSDHRVQYIIALGRMWYPKFFHKESKRVQLPMELPVKYRITEYVKEGYPSIFVVDKKTFLFYRSLKSSIVGYASLEEALQAIAKDKIED